MFCNTPEMQCGYTALPENGATREQSVQPKITILILSFVLSLAACQTSQEHAASAPATAEVTADDEAFLIESAAADFRAHVGADGVSFRNVHAGVTHAEGGGPPMSALCGEFRASGDAAQWRSFAIVRMSDYEMWFGPSSYCRSETTVLDSSRDLTALLSRHYHP